jgi:hypothetical protein
MRIIIVQSEIEAAIAAHILGQMSINDDMELEIELNATRGSEGYTANIEVVPKTQPGAKKAKKKAAPAATSTSSDEPEKKAEKATPAKEEPTKPDEKEDSEAAPTGSIFGALRKPVNEPTDG